MFNALTVLQLNVSHQYHELAQILTKAQKLYHNVLFSVLFSNPATYIMWDGDWNLYMGWLPAPVTALLELKKQVQTTISPTLVFYLLKKP